jgi:hypothetical protein
MTLQNKTDFVDEEVVASIQNARLEGMRDLLQNGLQGAHAVSQHCPGWHRTIWRDREARDEHNNTIKPGRAGLLLSK